CAIGKTTAHASDRLNEPLSSNSNLSMARAGGCADGSSWLPPARQPASVPSSNWSASCRKSCAEKPLRRRHDESNPASEHGEKIMQNLAVAWTRHPHRETRARVLVPTIPFLDREREVGELRASLDAALGGSGRIVL